MVGLGNLEVLEMANASTFKNNITYSEVTFTKFYW